MGNNYNPVYFVLTLFLASLVFLTGCFDVKREIKMYPNGSGLENIYVTLDNEFFEKMRTLAEIDKTGKWRKKLDTMNDNTLLENGIKMDIQKVGGTSIQELKITSKEDGSKEIFIQYFFDEPSVLIKVTNEATFSWSNQVPVQFTILKFIYDDEGNLTYKLTTRKAERYFNDELMQSVFSSMYSYKKINYTIEFPFEAKESNALYRSGNSLTWEMTLQTAMFDQQVDTAALVKDPELDLTYAEKIDRTIGRVSQKNNPLIRVQVYNRNKEPVKIGTGVD